MNEEAGVAVVEIPQDKLEIILREIDEVPVAVGVPGDAEWGGDGVCGHADLGVDVVLRPVEEEASSEVVVLAELAEEFAAGIRQRYDPELRVPLLLVHFLRRCNATRSING